MVNNLSSSKSVGSSDGSGRSSESIGVNKAKWRGGKIAASTNVQSICAL